MLFANIAAVLLWIFTVFVVQEGFSAVLGIITLLCILGTVILSLINIVRYTAEEVVLQALHITVPSSTLLGFCLLYGRTNSSKDGAKQ